MKRARVATAAAASAVLLAGIVTAGPAHAAAAPTPAPSPTQSGSAAPTPPPIALQPPGSSTAGPLVGITADDGAKVIAYKWLDLRTVDITMYSPAIQTNLVTRVLVPKGWSQAATTTWPVVYMLHGGDDDYTSWTRETTISQLSSNWNVIVAMPDAGRAASYTNFYNKGKFGTPAWETAHTVELRQILERGFRAGPQRAVAGLSSGGYGSMAYATRNPGLYKFAASYSGAISIRTSPMREGIIALDSTYGDPTLRFGTPFIDEANWAAHDPYTQAAKLRGTGVFISSGYTGLPATDDTVAWNPIQVAELFSGNVALKFSTKLSLLGIPNTLDLYALGEHAWVSWQHELDKSWPLMMKSLGAQKI